MAVLGGLGMATLAPMPASGHSSYDGDPHGEGLFVFSFYFSQNRITPSVTDIQQDYHCVYAKVAYGGKSYTHAYSCGSTDSHSYTTSNKVWAYRCLTGSAHGWDCELSWSGYL